MGTATCRVLRECRSAEALDGLSFQVDLYLLRGSSTACVDRPGNLEAVIFQAMDFFHKKSFRSDLGTSMRIRPNESMFERAPNDPRSIFFMDSQSFQDALLYEDHLWIAYLFG